MHTGLTPTKMFDSAANEVITTANGALRITNLTTTEKDALTAANGMLVYDSTLNQIQCYVNGSWVDID